MVSTTALSILVQAANVGVVWLIGLAIDAAELAGMVKERFGRDAHPRSIERALARREKKRRATASSR